MRVKVRSNCCSCKVRLPKTLFTSVVTDEWFLWLLQWFGGRPHWYCVVPRRPKKSIVLLLYTQHSQEKLLFEIWEGEITFTPLLVHYRLTKHKVRNIFSISSRSWLHSQRSHSELFEFLSLSRYWCLLGLAWTIDSWVLVLPVIQVTVWFQFLFIRLATLRKYRL